MFKKRYKARRVRQAAKKTLRFPAVIGTSLVLLAAVIVSTIINKGLTNAFSDSLTSSKQSSGTSTAKVSTNLTEVSNVAETPVAINSSTNQSTAVSAEETVPSQETSATEVYAEGTSDAVYNTSASYTTYATTTNATLSNGNTAGATGSYAAAQMAAATGVSQSTWEYIIARESNGDSSAANASGASGLFQTMPGWGSTATVDDQIQSAINAYNAQGMSAWGY